MKHIYFFPFCLGLILFTSCKDENIKTYHANGKVKEVISIVNDSIRHGQYLRYDETGKLAEEAIFLQGQLDQVRKLYHANGQLNIEEHYTNGKFNGPYNVYDENGKLKLAMNYEDNVINGTSKAFYPSGSIKEEVTFVDNQENGPFKEYHPNGKIWWDGTYRNGDNEYGLLMEYDSTGTLIKKMMCDSIGLCRSIWKLGEGDIKIES